MLLEFHPDIAFLHEFMSKRNRWLCYSKNVSVSCYEWSEKTALWISEAFYYLLVSYFIIRHDLWRFPLNIVVYRILLPGYLKAIFENFCSDMFIFRDFIMNHSKQDWHFIVPVREETSVSKFMKSCVFYSLSTIETVSTIWYFSI